MTSTLDATLSESETEIDRRFDASGFVADAAAGLLPINVVLPRAVNPGFDVASSRLINADTLTTLDGRVGELPGGDILATFTAAFDWREIQSADTRTLQEVTLTRRRIASGANLVLPITSTRTGFGDALGNVTLNAQAGFEELSDFGVLGDWNVGLTWAPTSKLDLSATYIWREVAPSLGALGNPTIANFNVPVFDFVNGETVLATVITGGNPDLPPETQRDWKFAANWEIPFLKDTRFTIEYIRNRSSDVVSPFPQITSEVEAAFPGRVIRDDDGRLLQLDRRSVSFSQIKADRLQFTLTRRGSIGAGPDGGGFGGPGGGMMRMLGGGGGSPSGGGAGGPPGGGGTGGAPAGTGAGGPPTAAQREQFMALRQRLCADDGADFVNRLVDAVESGEDLSASFPGFDPERFEQLLSRVRKPDGTIDRERLGQMRTQICSIDPALFGASAGGGQAGSATTAAGGAPAGGPPAGARPGGAAGGFGPSAMQGWRYFVNLIHTIELENEIVIAPGLAALDQLDGGATGAFGFPRHSSRLEFGIFGKGVGMRLSGRYTGKTRIDGSGLPGSTDVFFDDIATVNLRLFTNLGEVTGKNDGFLKDFRVTLRADNLFDAQRKVRDQFGNTPLNYQPFLFDPLGLNVGIELRKLF
jgi:uncharacterized membrane protein YgcG